MNDRFRGALLGLAVGDSWGRHYEGIPETALRTRFPDIQSLCDQLPDPPWHYTDDTQMTIAVCEALLDDGAIEEATLCRRFVENFDAHRGYGYGARVVLTAMEEGQDYQHWSHELFPGGSYGNGAAMRVAPVGLAFRDRHDRLLAESKASALPTHVHALGIEGANLIALAVAYASTTSAFCRNELFDLLENAASEATYQEKLSIGRSMGDAAELISLGNGIAAQDSVPTAIACAAIYPDSYEQAVATCLHLGGDTDTIAAMTGAIVGAYVGVTGIPEEWLDRLEDDQKGKSYIASLADQLAERFGSVHE